MQDTTYSANALFRSGRTRSFGYLRAMATAPAERYMTRRQEDSMAVPGSCFSIVVTAVFVGPTGVRKCKAGCQQEREYH